MSSAENGVALVYPYFRDRDPVPRLFPPLGIAYLAGQLNELGIPVTLCDCTFARFPDSVRRLVDARPAIIGISVMVTMSRNAFELLAALRKELPGTLFVAGGPLPTVLPQMFLPHFDVVFCGEGDIAFPAFCRDYLARGADRGKLAGFNVGRYPGMAVMDGGTIRSSAPVHNSSEILDRLPLPDRSGFDHARYQAAMQESTGARQASLMVTRGCPFACDFCSRPVWGNVFRKPPLEKIFREIDGILALGYNSLWIADDCFTLDTDFLTAFCGEMIRRKKLVTWTCLSRVDRLNRELVALMRDAGCTRVFLGLESGADETLRLMNKRVTVVQGAEAVRLFSEAGIGTAGFFIVGYPGETHESVEQTFSFALSLPLDECWFTVPLPLPGTPLFSRVADPERWEDWEFSNQVKFVYPSAFDPVWLERRIGETMVQLRERHPRHPGAA